MDMLLTGIYLLSAALALLSGRSEQAGAAVLTGAGDAVELCLRLGGSICLWSAVMELLEKVHGKQKRKSKHGFTRSPSRRTLPGSGCC